MGVRETLRDMRDAEITAQKKSEKKRQFENLIYKTIKKEFDTSTDTVDGVYMELIRRKNEFIYNLTPPDVTLYEASKIYNRILKELHKENSINILPIENDIEPDAQAPPKKDFFKKWVILNMCFLPFYIFLYLLSILF